MKEVILRLSELLYSDAPEAPRIPVVSILGKVAQAERDGLEEAIALFERRGLLALSIDRSEIWLTLLGKESHARGSSVALCLGFPYLCQTLPTSVVAIEVLNDTGDTSMGSGFFCVDTPGWIVTAAHVIQNRRITGIFDSTMERIHGADPDCKSTAPGGPDLAMIRCDIPESGIPLAIEWDLARVNSLDSVLVAGYPSIPNHDRAFIPSEGTVLTVGKKYGTNLQSLLISRITTPGFSGGPVISSSGRVIGVVEQENVLQELEHAQSVFISATPARYIAELIE